MTTTLPILTVTAVAPTVSVRVINGGTGVNFVMIAGDNSSGSFDDSNWNSSISYPGSGTSINSGQYHDTTVTESATLLRVFLFDPSAKKGDSYLYGILVSPSDSDWQAALNVKATDPTIPVSSAAASGSTPASISFSPDVNFTFDNETGGYQFSATAEADTEGRFTGKSDWQNTINYDSDFGGTISNSPGTSVANVLAYANNYYRVLIYSTTKPTKGTNAVAGALISADWSTLSDTFGSNAFNFSLTSPNGTTMLTLGSGSVSPSPSSKKPNPWLPGTKGPLGLDMWIWYLMVVVSLLILFGIIAGVYKKKLL